jgi:ribosomal protein L19
MAGLGKGKIIYLKYILIKEDEIKILNFIGLCIQNNKGTIILQNRIKKDSLRLTVKLNSPTITEIRIVKGYIKKSRLSKIFYVK